MKIIKKPNHLPNAQPRKGDYFYLDNQLVIIVYDEALKEYVLFNAVKMNISKEGFSKIQDLLEFYKVETLYSDNNLFMVIEGNDTILVK